MLDDLDDMSQPAHCPNCGMAFPAHKPMPGCNECECCFCSVECRTEHHLLEKLEHDYSKPMQDLS